MLTAAPPGPGPPLSFTWQAFVWEIASGKLVATFNTDQGLLGGAFTPDSKMFATGELGKAKLWRIADGKLMHTFGARQDKNSASTQNAVFHIDFAPPKGADNVTRTAVWAADGALIGGSVASYTFPTVESFLTASTTSTPSTEVYRRLKPGASKIAYSPDGALVAMSVNYDSDPGGLHFYNANNLYQLDKRGRTVGENCSV